MPINCSRSIEQHRNQTPNRWQSLRIRTQTKFGIKYAEIGCECFGWYDSPQRRYANEIIVRVPDKEPILLSDYQE